jgi:hypothetical protein
MYTLTQPTLEPVTLAEAKLSARVDGSEWDDIISGAITAARQVAEQETGRRFMSQVVRFELTDWPDELDLFAVYRPTAVAVSYWDGSAWVALTSGTDYAWAPVDTGFSVVPPLSGSFPTLGEVAIGPLVRIDATVGATDAANVEGCVKTFIKALVTIMVHDPALTADTAASALLRGLLDPVRVYA